MFSLETLGMQTNTLPNDCATWDQRVTQWANWLKAGNTSPETIKLRKYQLGRIVKTFKFNNPADLEAQQLIDWLASQDWSNETRRSMRAALRSFYTWMQDEGHRSDNPAKRLPRVAPKQPRPRPAPEIIYRETLARARDERIALGIKLMRHAGLRRGEVVKISRQDLHEDLAGMSLLVHRKGDKTRLVPLPDELGRELARLTSEGWLLTGGVDGHMSAKWFGKLVSWDMAGDWTPHTLRHAFATSVYQATGGDLRVTQELLGHASVATTQIYVAVETDALRKAVLLAQKHAA